MADNEFEPITPESRQRLYELDREMAEYREALKDPNSEEFKEWRRAQEIFAQPFSFGNSSNAEED